MSIRHAGSRFAQDFENIADLGFEGGLKMSLIQVDSIKSTLIVSPELSIRHAGSRFVRDLDKIAPLDNVGWVKNVVDSIKSNRHKSYESTEVCGHVLRASKFRVSLFHGS